METNSNQQQTLPKQSIITYIAKISRSSFYFGLITASVLLFPVIGTIIIFIISPSGHMGLGGIGVIIFIIFLEILFIIVSIISYEIFRKKYKDRMRDNQINTITK